MLEIQSRFGVSSERRVDLFDKLARFVKFAQGFNIFSVLYVDGSFVTDKDHPGDVDGALAMPLAGMGTLLAHADRASILDRSAVKRAYEVHLFFQPEPLLPGAVDWAQFFQGLKPEDALTRNLPPDALRGILKVSL